jgi:hypothetical protein
MRATELREDAVTHTLPAPAAIPFAAPATAIERSTRALRGSIRNTDRPWALGTQTAPSPTASPSAEPGSGTETVARPPAGSTRLTARLVASATHT